MSQKIYKTLQILDQSMDFSLLEDLANSWPQYHKLIETWALVAGIHVLAEPLRVYGTRYFEVQEMMHSYNMGLMREKPTIWNVHKLYPHPENYVSSPDD